MIVELVGVSFASLLQEMKATIDRSSNMEFAFIIDRFDDPMYAKVHLE